MPAGVRSEGLVKWKEDFPHNPWYLKWLDICDVSPVEFCNYCGVVWSLGLVFCIFSMGVFVSCPILYGQDGCTQQTLIALFILTEILINFACFHVYGYRNRVSYWIQGRLHSTQGDQCEVTRFCSSCEEVVPRRAHHCPLCKYCVLRKDHHCYLVGACVGLGNHRYFITFLFWAAMGAAYGTLYAYRYLNTFYREALPFGWIEYVGPFALLKWVIFQHTSMLNVTQAILFSAGIGSTIGALGFFTMQWVFIFKGMTMRDIYRPRDKSDEGGICTRIRLIFGPYWLINFIFPMPCFRNRLDANFRKSIYNYCLKDI